MQGQRSTVDALGVALCGMGAALMLTHGLGATGLLLLAGALYGMHRLLSSRAALWAIGAVVAMWFFGHFWELAPIKDSYKLVNEHPTIHAAPEVAREIAWAALVVIIAVIARARTGTALMIVVIVAMAIGTIADLAGRALDLKKDSTEGILFGGIAKGWADTTATLLAACFIAVALAPKVDPLPRRFGASLGVAGGALLAATFEGMPESVSGGHDAAVGLSVLAMAIAWVLSAVGLGAFARAGGGWPAWVGMALAIVQVLVLPLGLALGETAQSLRAPMTSVLELGFLGIGLAAVFAPSIGLPRARGVVGALALVAVFGSFATLGRFADRHVGHLGDAVTGLKLYTYVVGDAAAALWAACLAYLVTPPRDT